MNKAFGRPGAENTSPAHKNSQQTPPSKNRSNPLTLHFTNNLFAQYMPPSLPDHLSTIKPLPPSLHTSLAPDFLC
jgi:hypothetical protein